MIVNLRLRRDYFKMRFEIRILYHFVPAWILLWIMHVIIEIKKIKRQGEQKLRPGYLKYFFSRRSSSRFYDGQYFEF